MALSGFNVERDVSLQIYDPLTGQVQNFAISTEFDSKQKTTQLKVGGLDGKMRYAEDPEGWDGSFSFERGSSALDDWVANMEAAYYSGVNIGGATILETISEPDGRITQYRYDGCAFKLSDGGKWSKSKTVSQKLDFIASRRIKVQ